jgi:hypothetical protein
MKPALVIGAILPVLFFCSAPAWAQGALAGPPVAFAPVTRVPLLSASGRFSSLNPPNRRNCPYKQVTGRVVSPRLIMVKDIFCGRRGHDNVLVNVQFNNPADAMQMVTGRRVTIAARFRSAQEDRAPLFYAEFLIAEGARLVAALDRSAAPAEAFTSYMVCQPPELDALAARLGRELCAQSTLVENLTVAGPALETAARAPANASPEDAVAGDANAITCRLDPQRSDRQLPAIACARNSYWVWYKAKWGDPLSSTPAPA